MEFIALLLPVIENIVKLGIQYGPDIAALFTSGKNVIAGKVPDQKDWNTLHAVIAKVDEERHRIERGG